MDFATVPEAPPTRKNHRETSCPPPISAKVPYQRRSKLICSALSHVSIGFAVCSRIIARILSFRDGGVEKWVGCRRSDWPRERLQGHLVISERPFAHETDALGAEAINDQFGIVGRSEVAAEEGIRLPDVVEHRGVGKDFRETADADLVVSIV